MFRRFCQIHSFRFSMATDCEELEPGIASLFPASSTTYGKCRAEWSIGRRHGNYTGVPSYLSHEDGHLIHETQLIDDALDDLEWRITTRILRNLVQFVQLHAAGLVAGGKALLLVGPSGAGKSSLALCMLRQGWKCLSDEIILIDAATGAVWPFPRSFRVDFKTLIKIFPEHPVKSSGPLHRDSMGKIRLDPSLAISDWIAGPSPPGWIVFPSYQPDRRSGLQPLGETEAFGHMVSQAINLVDHGKRGLDILLSLVRRFQCFRLNAADLHAATSLLSGLAEEVQRWPRSSNPAVSCLMKRVWEQ
jgi:hypothetical protein